MKKHSYIGLDVHKESISIAVAEGGREGEVRDYGRVGGSLIALIKLLLPPRPDAPRKLSGLETKKPTSKRKRKRS